MGRQFLFKKRDRNGREKVYCCDSRDDDCYQARLLTPRQDPDDTWPEFFDAQLFAATNQINDILRQTAESDPREVAILGTPKGLMLARVESDELTTLHDDAAIASVLRFSSPE
jgi:hypothetical protein